MEDFVIASPRDAAARGLGQDAARTFVEEPAEGETMESFVLGEVTPEIVSLTRTMVTIQHGEIKAWRRRNFLAPIGLAIVGIVTSVASTPKPNSGDTSLPYLAGFVALIVGVVWLVTIAFKASGKVARAQEAREAETGRLLQIARDAAAQTYRELGGADRDAVAVAESENGVDDAATSAVADDAARELARQQRRAAASPPPAGQPFGVSQEAAEYLVVAWMRHLGEADAATAERAGERRVAVASVRYGARVVNDPAPVGAEAVRELVETTSIEGARPAFFAAGSYTDDAIEVAEQGDVALFVYDAVAGTLEGANELGRTAVLEGLA